MLIKSRAPLRISFGGGATDVPPYPEMRGGCVISSTISKYAHVILKPKSGKLIEIDSIDYDRMLEYKSISDVVYDGQLDLVKAAIKMFNIEGLGVKITTFCEAPPGSGLGSSSAVMVAIIGAFDKWLNKGYTVYEKADLAYQLERVELGMKGGLQDQYAASYGGFNFIEFQKDSVIVNPLRIRPEILNELHSNLLLFNTGRARPDKILDRQIKATEDKKKNTMDSLDFIKELAIDMKNSLLKGNLSNFAELMDEGWGFKKKLDKSISNKAIDTIYKTAKHHGALGGKITGAGGGGHLILYCDLEHRRTVTKVIADYGCIPIPFSFEHNGLQAWEVNDGSVRA